MTAQVAVMNTLGIALASDSAVTVSSGVGKTRKIYSSADKLFQLSEVAPVAIMISGSSRFLEMPWETVIKVYRDQLGEKTFAKLSGYADHFFRFVRTNTEMFPQSMRDEFVDRLIIGLLRDVWDASSERQDEIDASEDSSDKNISSVIHEVVAEKLQAEKKTPKMAGFGPTEARALRRKYGKKIAAMGKKFFEDFSLPAKTHRALNALIAESISSTNFRVMTSGIVFAGFGESEYMPACLEYEVEGMVQNKLRYWTVDKTQISSQLLRYIDSFGQDEAVKSFLNGVSPEFRSYMEQNVDNFVEATVSAFERVSGHEYDARETKKLATILRKEWGDLSAKWDEGEYKSSGPVFDMVEFLPKDELAATAENLVNLTKSRLRVSPEQETVGGPIDVAVITKGDGFVWVKKKQYYPAELNPHKTGRPV